ncbi:MAG: PQQ-binding-like beta-propeller repeat protein, partial [Planctomycetales bacterium]
AQVVTPQGDGWLRSFDAQSGDLIWKFDMNYKSAKLEFRGGGNRNNLLAAPVYHAGRIYLASGHDVDLGPGPGRLCCIDPTKLGDVSAEIVVDENGVPLAEDDESQGRIKKNPNSALNWEFGPAADRKAPESGMERSITLTAIHKDLVIAATSSGFVHCLDARTGKRYWTHETDAPIHASPLIADDKIYVADENGDVTIIGLSDDPTQAFRDALKGDASSSKRIPLARHDMAHSIYCSPIFVNGVLYVAARGRLYAISKPPKESTTTAKPTPINNAERRRGPRAAYYPTPRDVVEKMIDAAELKPDEVVVDLGSGDGRILFAAAKRGARAVGYEINPRLVEQSREEATRLRLSNRVTIRREDLFQADLSEVDVVFTYLQSHRLERLLPNFKQLKPGARIVSHAFTIPGVAPKSSIRVRSRSTGQEHLIYLWTAPLQGD